MRATSSSASRRPDLSKPAGSLGGLPNLCSHTSTHEDTVRLVWGFATKTRLQLTFLSRSLRPLSVFLGMTAGSWANHFFLSLGFPLARAGVHGFCRHRYSRRLPEVTPAEPSLFSVKGEKAGRSGLGQNHRKASSSFVLWQRSVADKAPFNAGLFSVPASPGWPWLGRPGPGVRAA